VKLATRTGLLTFLLAANAAGQERERCNFPNFDETRQNTNRLPSGQYNTFAGGGIRGGCPGKQITLRSDSLELYGEEGRIYLVRNVDYKEPRLAVTSDYLTYYQRDERFVATGNVVVKLPNGSVIRGPVMEYFRASPGIRTVPRLDARGRTSASLVQRDSLGQPTTPLLVDANTVTMVGDSLVYAAGEVVVTREDIIARADSMHLDTEREYTILLRRPSIEGRRDRPFTLYGDRIELTGRSKKLDRVLSSGRARAVSEDMILTSDTIDLRVVVDLLQRATAWGPSRARAASATQQIVADSIVVDMPNQRVREMHAVRRAVAEGRPDSTRFRADTTDWMRGDTIVARFDTAATGDTTARTRIRELIAKGSARSYYHLAPADTAMHAPAINYVVGREITVSFESQRVAKVTIRDKAAGVYLEPKVVAAKPDTTRTPPTPARTTPARPTPRPRPSSR
jgi:lipopolysaccharide export system protein LptA